jgi:type IV secretory pathway VirB10-like protein
MTPNVLAPRKVSRVKILLGIAFLAGFGYGMWYVYTEWQARMAPPQTQPKSAQTMPSSSTGISSKKLAHAPLKEESNGVKIPEPVPPPSGKLVHAEKPGWVDELKQSMHDLGEKMSSTYSRGTNQAEQPNAQLAAVQKQQADDRKAARQALAESRKAPLVVIKTETKAEGSDLRRTLQQGWKIPFLIESAVNSDVGSEFVGRVSEVVYASSHFSVPLIPQGASVLGSSSAAKLIPGNQRLPMMGVSISIPGIKAIDLGSLPMMDQQGQMGMVGDIDHHRLRQFGGIFVGGFLRGATRMAQSEARSLGPVAPLGSGIAQGVEQGTNREITQVYDVRPTIRVYQGDRGYILMTKELKIPGGSSPER